MTDFRCRNAGGGIPARGTRRPAIGPVPTITPSGRCRRASAARGRTEPRYPDDFASMTPGYIKPADVAWYCSHHHIAEGPLRARLGSMRLRIEHKCSIMQARRAANSFCKVKAVARRKQLSFRWVPERGSGRHGTLYVGTRFTVVKDLKKELGRVCWPTCLGDWGFARRTSDIHRDISGSFHPGGRRKRVPCSFSGLPEALTGGTDLEDTREQATDCLAEALAGRIKRGDEIPRPRKPKRGQHSISVPLSLAPKLALYLAMRDSGMRNTGLTKRLGVSETVVRRMLDPRPTTRPERIQAALTELGKRIVITFEDAA